MDFTQSYFELLKLPKQYAVDNHLLAKNYRLLQKEFHPDRFVSQSASEQRLAVQFAAYINTAHQTLKSSVLRAEYLLQLAGHNVDHQNTTLNDGEFLMAQMQWRESLSDIRQCNNVTEAQKQLEALEGEVKQVFEKAQVDFNEAYCAQDFLHADAVVAKLHFIEKMIQEIDAQMAFLLDQ